MRVAIQGVKGSYSEEAATQLLGNDARIVECGDFFGTFDTFDHDEADYVVVPVENKIVGAIQTPKEIIRARSLKILGSLELKVDHVLTGTWDAHFRSITSVRSHVEALKQCKNFLARHSHLTQIIGSDTAGSVLRIVNEGDPKNAAIGSRRAAELYGAKVLLEDIADDADNWTTFCLIGK